MIIANAGTFPELGAVWYERHFPRVIATLATTFRYLAEEKVLHINDSLSAANRFSGLLLWHPVNKAMFYGGLQHTQDELDRYATAGVKVFLGTYR